MREIKIPKFFLSLFHDDPERGIKAQNHYEKRIGELIEALELRYVGFYSAAMHDNMVFQLVRAEMMIEKLERDVWGYTTNENTSQDLNNERKHYKDILDRLMVSIESSTEKGKRVEKKDADARKSLFNLDELIPEDDPDSDITDDWVDDED